MGNSTGYKIVAATVLGFGAWIFSRMNPEAFESRGEYVQEAEHRGHIWDDAYLLEGKPRARSAPVKKAKPARKADYGEEIYGLHRQIGEANKKGKAEAQKNWLGYELKRTKEFWKVPEFMEDEGADELYDKTASEDYRKASGHFIEQTKKAFELRGKERDYIYEKERDELDDLIQKRMWEIQKDRDERAKIRAENAKKYAPSRK